MSVRRTFLAAILIISSMSMLALQSAVQGVPGFAEISSPRQGEVVNGIITIQGTADHPTFEAYELEFSYDPNPTNTWFPITEPIHTPVQEEGLALWDTRSITPGTYQIRLRVHPEGGQTIEALMADIRVGMEAETSQDLDVSGQDQLGELESDQVESTIIQPDDSEIPDEPMTPTETLWRLLIVGALTATLLLITFGLYTTMRPRVRDYVGLLRMRRLHRQQGRSDRRKESGQ
jgi:hypothetical protein